ncbi:mycothiol conjugate amidase Mca [Humidisolicoccus flavus]|uniref:mycothiol conjugate amidase Mca n=1 Tax=Humidisolicoccus flavus TaxID=3111414 RepID=UPI00325474BC
MELSLLAVHAHPDDESSKGAATYAAYRARGAAVTVVSCTGGERGDVLNSTLVARGWAERDLAGLRRSEMSLARAHLGVDHVWLGYFDSGLPDEGEPLPPLSFATVPVDTAARPLVRIIRERRPQVMVTYDENGGYPHPDHIQTHRVAMRAAELAADPSFEPGPEALGEPHRIDKIYYDKSFSVERVQAILDASEAHPELVAPERLERLRGFIERLNQPGRVSHTVTTRVECADYFEQRDAALRSHASQVSPDDEFFFWPNELLRTAWPTEDYVLVHSTVESTLPENDLFAGIGEAA